MSPFLVTTEQDSGYAATNTLAGTRLNTAIANTPVALSVMTREFLNDIGAIDANRAIEYALNAANDTTDATGNSTWQPFNYRVRGFANATVTRNYFGTSFLSDAYNVDSYEVARGPNSVLFGIASPAGVFNSTIKVARPGQNITAVQLRTGSFDEYRGTVDVARTFGRKKNLALRLNLLAHQAKGFYEFEKTRRHAATLTGTWRPFRSTSVRIEYEQARFFDAKARSFPVSDGFRDWAAAGGVLHTVPATRPALTNSMFASAVAGGIYFFPESTVGPRPIASSGDYFRTSLSTAVRGGLGTDIPGIFDTSIVPRAANLLGPNNGNTSDQKIAGIFVEQRFGRVLALEAAYYGQVRDYLSRLPEVFNDNLLFIQVSTNDPVFDPSTGALTGYQPNQNAGRYLTRSAYQELESYQRSDNFRLTASYELDLSQKEGWKKWLGHHRLGGLLLHSFSKGDTIQRREANVASDRRNPDLTNVINGIVRVNYIDFTSPDPALHGMQDASRNPVSGKLLGAPGFSVQSGLANIAWSASRNTVDSAIIATQSSFLKERLWFTGGIRRDIVANEAPTVVRDPVSREYLGVTYNLPGNPKVKDTTNSFGAVYQVTSWFSLFANQSDNFAVQASSLLFGETGANAFSGNTKGQGRDVGIRSKLFDGRVNLNLGYYKTGQVGQYYSPPGTYGGLANIIWQSLGQSRPLLVGGELQDLNAQGLEFELTANPLKNLRLTFNYTRTNRYSQDRPFGQIVDYFNRNKDTWLSPANAAIRPTNTSYGATIQEIWNYYQQTLATDTGTNGRMPFAFRPESGNAFARYDFRTGALKGLAVGGGINWRGPMVLAYANNDSSQQIRGYEQTYVNALLAYERRFLGKFNASFQLNVDNVFNFDDRYPRRYYWFGDAQGPSMTYQYSYLVRRWSLSTTLRF